VRISQQNVNRFASQRNRSDDQSVTRGIVTEFSPDAPATFKRTVAVRRNYRFAVPIQPGEKTLSHAGEKTVSFRPATHTH
jgi:hypothetical protein